MPLVEVRREPEGSNRREPVSEYHLHPTSKHQWWSGSYHRLHCGSDSARALHGRLLFLPSGELNASIPSGPVSGPHAKLDRVGALRVHTRRSRNLFGSCYHRKTTF